MSEGRSGVSAQVSATGRHLPGRQAMNCPKARNKLSAHIDGELSPDVKALASRGISRSRYSLHPEARQCRTDIR